MCPVILYLSNPVISACESVQGEVLTRLLFLLPLRVYNTSTEPERPIIGERVWVKTGSKWKWRESEEMEKHLQVDYSSVAEYSHVTSVPEPLS